jgi:hypothetical protein
MATPIINYEEGLKRIEAITDPVTRTLVNFSMMKIAKKLISGSLPVTPLDGVFLVEILVEIMGQHSVIRLALDGEEFSWTS